MSGTNDQDITKETANEPILAESVPQFSPEQLVDCPKCGRSNAPNRAGCMYCGQTLPSTADNAASDEFSFRRLEQWEPGVNLIVRPGSKIRVEKDIESAAKLLSFSAADVAKLFELNRHMPVARLENKELAETAATILSRFGIETILTEDDALDIEHPPVRLRKCDLDDESISFVDFNSGETYKTKLFDIGLLVTGRIVEGRHDETTKRSRGKSKVLTESETAAEYELVDLYLQNDARGFRISTNGFDFSCLGDDMGILAGDNLHKLAEEIHRRAPDSALIADYDSIRGYLDLAWPPEVRKGAHGLQIAGFGKREFGSSVIVSNLSQFNRFSRMTSIVR